jgi:cytochrome oxidase Cu insertion factor (SCO1/SenC/PrrC family)
VTLFKIILPLITLVLVALPTIRVSAQSDKPHSNKHNENTASLNRQLEYEPPAPGSYRLPPIQQAVDGDVVDADGREHNLFELMEDKYVVLSFIFTTCSDLKGCPLATRSKNMLFSLIFLGFR